MREIGDIETLDAALAHRRAVVLFHANWCSYCRVFKPVFDELAPGARGCDAFEVVLDDLDNPLWDKYGIDVVPTVIFFDDGKIARRLDGRLGVGLAAADLGQAVGDANAAGLPPALPDGIRAGIELFNRGEFHRAHELMERAWRETPGPERVLYQALVQAAVACWRIGDGKPEIALMLINRGLPKLEAFRPAFAGIDVESLHASIVVLRDRIAAPKAPGEHLLPKIHSR